MLGFALMGSINAYTKQQLHTGKQMHSSETGLLLLAGSANVGLGVLAGETLSTEMMDGLSVLGSSKEEGVGSYYNFILELARDTDS